MIRIRERTVVDAKGRKVSVLLNIRDYKRLLDYLEDIEDVIAYDKAKMTRNEIIPFEQAIKEIEAKYGTRF